MSKKVFWAPLLERAPIGECVSSIINVAMTAGARGYSRIMAGYQRTDYVRNWLVDRFLELSDDPLDTLVMLDDDHQHPANIIEHLVKYDDYPVLSALTFRRGEPYDPIMFYWAGTGWGKIAQWTPGLIYKVDLATPACTAYQRRVFTALEDAGYKRPYWRYEYNEAAPEQLPSEDMYFGDICRRAGIAHYVDTAICSPHYTGKYVDQSIWDFWLEQHPEVLENSHTVTYEAFKEVGEVAA